MKKNKKTVLVLLIAIVFSFLNILHVVLPAFKIPKDTQYMAVGHSFNDYFNLLSFVNEGKHGSWKAYNAFTGEDLGEFLLTAWPNLLIGKLARLLSLTPQLGYWLAVFFLGLGVILSVYFLLTLALEEKKYLVLPVFLAYIFSGPFFKIESLRPFKFYFYNLTWYYRSPFFDRLSIIPHFLLSSLFIIWAFIASYYFFESLKNGEIGRKTMISFGMVTVFLILILSLTPIKIIYWLVAFGIVTAGQLFGKVKKRSQIFLLLLMFLATGLTFFLFGLYLRSDIGPTYFPEVKEWERRSLEYPSLKSLILGSGPILVLALASTPFILGLGILGKINPTILFGFTATCLSYILFYTRFSLLFDNHNSRLIFPEAYLFMPMVFFLMLDRVGEKLKLNRYNLVWTVCLLLVVFSVPSLYSSVRQRIGDASSVAGYYQYPPNGLVAGFKYIDQRTRKKEVVLTSQRMANLLPSFADIKAFVCRPLATIDYDRKLTEATMFFSGRLNSKDKYDFLHNNGIKYIIVTPFDEWDDVVELFVRPLFITSDINIKELFVNSQIKVFEFTP